MALKIIRAQPEHIFWIRMLWEMLIHEIPEEYPTFSFPTEGDNFTRAVVKAMQGPDRLFASFLAFMGKRAVGLIAGEIRYRPIGTPHWYACGHWFYVRPEHRGRGIASALLREGLAWIREHQVPVEEGNSHHTTTVEALELTAAYGRKTWEQWGFKPFISTFVCSMTDIAIQKPAKVKKLPAVQPQIQTVTSRR